MMERFTADGEDSINKGWLVFDNEECYCCFGPTTQLNAVAKARELNEKHAGKDEVSALKTRIAELEAMLAYWKRTTHVEMKNMPRITKEQGE